jgi:hypothetical protein
MGDQTDEFGNIRINLGGGVRVRPLIEPFPCSEGREKISWAWILKACYINNNEERE